MHVIAAVFIAALAQEDESPKAWLDSATAAPAVAKPGDVVKITISIGVAPQWHIYPTKKQDFAKETSFRFEGGAAVAGRIEEPATKRHSEKLNETENLEYDYIEGDATFVIPVRVPAGAKPGEFAIQGTVEGQVCKGVCHDMTLPFEVRIRVVQEEERHLEILSVTPDKGEVARGETLKLAFRVRVAEGWYIYSVRDTFEKTRPTWALDASLALAGDIAEPAPKQHRKKEDWDRDYGYHDGTVEFIVPVRFKPGTKPGPAAVSGALEYQICSDVCIDEKAPFSVKVTVLDKDVDPSGAPTGGAAGAAAKEFEEKGWLWLIGFAIAGGLFSLIQPCVYPLIPLTVTSFVKQSEKEGSRPFLFGAMYGLGIIVTFTAVGFGLSLAMGPAGAQIFAANPWVNLAIAVMFFAFALSMFGLFEIKLPDSWTSRVAGSRKGGVGGAFLLGLVFAVVSFTCTIPWAATILGISASSGHRFAGLVGMLIYSATMAVPFFLLGFFPAFLKRLPKGGTWMQTVKVTGGFLELGIAFAYIWKPDHVWGFYFFKRDIVLWLWVILCVCAVAYLLVLAGRQEGRWKFSLGRAVSATAFAALAAWLVGGYAYDVNLGPMNTVLPPFRSGATHESLASALEEAKRKNKPIFVEFTGVT
jgi:thiol:disulfide interchange protein DsbD